MPVAAPPTSGIRSLVLEIRDANGRSRKLSCIDLAVANPSDSERVPFFCEGVLRAVLRGNDAISEFSYTLDVASFVDPSAPTPDEILSGTGAGANWSPINDQIVGTRVDSAFRMFWFWAHLDARSLGGSYTIRKWQGYAARPLSLTRADPNTAAYTGMVYGTTADSVVA